MLLAAARSPIPSKPVPRHAASAAGGSWGRIPQQLQSAPLAAANCPAADS